MREVWHFVDGQGYHNPFSQAPGVRGVVAAHEGKTGYLSTTSHQVSIFHVLLYADVGMSAIPATMSFVSQLKIHFQRLAIKLCEMG